MTIPKWFEIVIHTKPEHGQTVQAETDARVINDADIEIA